MAGTYSHHPFRKEDDLNQTSRELYSMLIFQDEIKDPVMKHNQFFPPRDPRFFFNFFLKDFLPQKKQP